MADELPDIDEETVTIDMVGDYTVELSVDGLPDGTIAVDYIEDDGRSTPRILVRAKEVSVDLVHEDHGENVYAVSVPETSDIAGDGDA